MTWLMPALPLAGAAVLLLVGRRGDARGHLVGCAASLGSFLVAVVAFLGMLGRAGPDRVMHEVLFSWVPVGGLQDRKGKRLNSMNRLG
ncbi:NADH-quinone oxidoreductase subunit L, partial [Mycobacteroides abscessus subsp. abscessus]|nr:NADH-quinone oxidoreductase subunit L [Mycobacteroides abscessus subsp. abscessus]